SLGKMRVCQACTRVLSCQYSGNSTHSASASSLPCWYICMGFSCCVWGSQAVRNRSNETQGFIKGTQVVATSAILGLPPAGCQSRRGDSALVDVVQEALHFGQRLVTGELIATADEGRHAVDARLACALPGFI